MVVAWGLPCQSGMVLGASISRPSTLILIFSTGGGAGLGSVVVVADILAQYGLPIYLAPAHVHDSKNVSSFRHAFINQPIRKSANATSSRGRVVKRKLFGIRPDFRQRQMNGVKKFPPQVFALAFIRFCCGHKFSIGFAMIGRRVHEMARSAERITSSAGRGFVLPSRISRWRRRISSFQARSEPASVFSSTLVRSEERRVGK